MTESTLLEKTGIILKYIFIRNDAVKQDIVKHVDPATIYSIRLCLSSFSAGMATGAYISGTSRARQFLAENSHRLPRTKGGWFQYHKAKNYAVLQHAGYGAFREAVKFTAITACYAGIEQTLESEFGEGFVNSTGCFD
jgi:hypothetical protein